jgi:hypothetical protein
MVCLYECFIGIIGFFLYGYMTVEVPSHSLNHHTNKPTSLRPSHLFPQRDETLPNTPFIEDSSTNGDVTITVPLQLMTR